MFNILNKLPDIFTRKKDTELGSLIGSVENSLEVVNKDLDLLDLQYNLNTSTGIWLDIWGDWFGVLRDNLEEDEDYRNRIMYTTLRPKCTIPAIISAVKSHINDDSTDINIYEPYQNIFKHNISLWGNKNHYPSKDYFSRGVIDIQSRFSVSPPMRKILEDIKSAGIRVMYTELLDIISSSGGPLDMFSAEIPSTDYNSIIDMFTHWMISPVSEYSSYGSFSGEQILWGMLAHSEVEFYTQFNKEDRKDIDIENKKNIMGYFSLSSRGNYSEDRGELSGYRLDKRDELYPISFEDSILSFEGDYIPYVENRWAKSRNSTISDMYTGYEETIVDYSQTGPYSGEQIAWGTYQYKITDLETILYQKIEYIQNTVLADIKNKELLDLQAGVPLFVEALRISNLLSLQARQDFVTSYEYKESDIGLPKHLGFGLEINPTCQRESTIYGESSLTISAGSSKVLGSIWEETLSDINTIEDLSQLPVESISVII